MTRTFIDVHAGSGGLAIGLERAGFVPLLLVEPDTDSRQTIAANRNWKIVPDIGEHPIEEVSGVDLLAANLPSTGISVAGPVRMSRGFQTYADALDVIISVRPRSLILVNVTGIMSTELAEARARIGNHLGELGYTFAWRVVDSADFGLPQARRRAVLIAFQSSVFSRFDWPQSGGVPPTVGDVLYPFMAANGWPGAAQWSRLADGIAPTVVGGSKRHGGADLGPTRTKQIWYSLGVDPRGIADFPPTEDTPKRAIPRLTNPMLAALQGFPLDWRFVGGKTSIYRQIAGSFPPPTAHALGVEIRRALEE